MLTELSIRDVALIPSQRLRFGPGLNVLSGETGAGKSLVVGSLRLLCGERADPEIVRGGAERAIVEGVFDVDPRGWIAARLAELGITVDDGEVILQREIARQGKGRARANGSTIPLATLKSAADCLVDLHGQHDHQSLLRADFQRDAVDDFAKSFELREQVAVLVREWRAANDELARLESVRDAEEERLELARFQWKEIEAAQPRRGQLDELGIERRRLERAQLLRDAAAMLEDRLLDGEGSVHDSLVELRHAADGAAAVDPDWESVAESLHAAALSVSDVARSARALGGRAVDDPERLAEVRDRIRVLQDLLKKYGPDEDAMFATWERVASEVEDPASRERRVAASRQRVQEISDRLARSGSQLTRARRAAAKKLCARVESLLGDLGMPGTRFAIHVGPRTTGVSFADESGERFVGASGFDTVEFRLTANRGEESLPLKAVASGGEISRVMLALKAALEQTRGTATMVFDEIDAGVGGRVAAQVASVLASLASGRQVVCITHLAAIASRATAHWCVSKHEEDGRTVSEVEPVTGEARVREIARMLGGDSDRGVAVEHARELLREGAS